MKKERFILYIISFISIYLAHTQPVSKSVMQSQQEYYTRFRFSSDSQWDSLLRVEGNMGISPTPTAAKTATCSLTHSVYGWHPYWNNSASIYQDYRWDLLSHFCYFSYEVNASDGTAVTMNNWNTTASVTYALSQGKKVHLCATLFANHATFFGSTTAQQTLITNLINAVQSRGAHGINIDFEGVPAGQSAAFTAFMINLCNQVHSAIPGSEVTIALYAVDWSNLFDEAALAPYVDKFIIMGYDYYWSGSTQAGPVDPLFPFTSGGRHLSRSVGYYRNQGVPASKLLLGLPYYGREWQTVSGTVPSNVLGGGTTNSRTWTYVRNNASGNYSPSNRYWEANSFSPAYIFNNGSWNQCFIQDKYSMQKRLDLIRQWGLNGMGIWALGYDDGYQEYWEAIETVFSDCGSVPCRDTLFDSGGANFNYYGNENYIFTIAPTGATQLLLQFPSFNLGNGDYLKVYDGTSTAAPLIGNYVGSTNPGTINSTSTTLTLEFFTDASSQNSGYTAIWECLQSGTLPVELIDFFAQLSGEDIEVRWSAIEVSVQKYILEKSRNGVDFFPILEVDAIRNHGINHYHYADSTLYYQNYYRLKLIDADGKALFSDTVSVTLAIEDLVKVFPIPITENNRVEIDFHFMPGTSVLTELSDISGKILAQNETTPTAHRISLLLPEYLASGIYLLKLRWDDTQSYFKLWKP